VSCANCQDANAKAPQDTFARMDLERQRHEIALLKEELLAQVTEIFTAAYCRTDVHDLKVLTATSRTVIISD